MSAVNEKLKTELSELVDMLETQLQKIQTKKEEEFNNYRNKGEKSEEVKSKDKELRKGQKNALSLKKEIIHFKRQLETTYDMEKITNLEDEKKNKERIVQEL